MRLQQLTERLKTLPAGKMRDRALHAAAVAAMAQWPQEFIEDAIARARRSHAYPHLVTLAWEASLLR